MLIWWDSVERIHSGVKREWEVSIDNGEIDVKIEVEMRKRWESDMIFWVVWRMKYDWRKQVIMKVESIFRMV